jgi:hypothetical protein
MGAREVLAKLRAESKRPDLETLEHEAREEERAEQYLASLRAERASAEAQLARLRLLRPESRTWLDHKVQEGEPPSAGERVVRTERRLEAIDAELERVGR